MPDYTPSPGRSLIVNDDYWSDRVALAFRQWIFLEDQDRQEKYRLYREYYDGDHELMLTDRQKEFLEHKTKTDFLANYCQIVVDTPAERMTVIGFDAPEGLGGASGLFWRWWKLNGMDARQQDVHKSSLRDGDTYLVVEWDSVRGLPVFSHEMAYDGSEGVSVRYRDDRREEIAFAVKYWVATAEEEAGYVSRATVYLPDEIMRFVADGRRGGEWRVEERLAWVDKDGRPLGVPVVPFPHQANGYRFGVSALDIVIPLQNLLNKAIIDLIAAADTSGFRILTMIGNTPGEDTKIAPGMIWSMPNPPSEGALGAIPGENLRPLIEVVDSFVQRIGQVTRTPLSYFQVSGQLASEGTQKQQEAGLISKIRAETVHFGNRWEAVMRIATRLYNAFGGGDLVLSEDTIVDTLWDDIEVRDRWEHRETQARTVKVLVEAGSSLEGAAIFAGIPLDDARRMMAVDFQPLDA